MKTPLLCCLASLALAFAATPARSAATNDPSLLQSAFIVENPPFPSSHASTIVETPDGLLASWFGGTEERATDVSIWLARNDGSGWSAPEEVANGVDGKRQRRYPCWNPVLFRRLNGDVLLFYKVGPSPEEWWGMVRVSRDGGRTWSAVDRLPGGFVGPVRNKPIELSGGVLLCGSSSEDKGWRVHMEKARDPMGLWERTLPLNAAYTYSAIQPTILAHSETLLQILCRTKQGWITQCWSTNGGATWSEMQRTTLPNPNSAVDAVRMRDGRFVLAYNHARVGRHVMNLAVSEDGRAWQGAVELENEPGAEFSYPAIIQTADGLIHVTYTWKRQRIKHAVLDPARFILKPLTDGR